MGLDDVFKLQGRSQVSQKMGWVICLSVFVLGGCATTQSSSNVNQLQIKVAQLERKLEDKDTEIVTLKKRIGDLEDDFDAMGPYSVSEPSVTYYSETTPVVRKESKTSVPVTKDNEQIIRVSADAATVQRALQKAGYYKGAIDGKVGSGTKAAIVDFQKDKGLKADGLIGQQTWNLLKGYTD